MDARRVHNGTGDDVDNVTGVFLWCDVVLIEEMPDSREMNIARQDRDAQPVAYGDLDKLVDEPIPLNLMRLESGKDRSSISLGARRSSLAGRNYVPWRSSDRSSHPTARHRG